MWVLSPGESYPGREPLCVPRGGCGCFPGASHTTGESPFVCRGAVVDAFPGRDIPRARVPFRPDHICVIVCDITVIVLYIRLKCQLSGDVLHDSQSLLNSIKSNPECFVLLTQTPYPLHMHKAQMYHWHTNLNIMIFATHCGVIKNHFQMF